MHPESLAAELKTAEELGIRPMHVADPEFEQMAQEGPIIWVVLEKRPTPDRSQLRRPYCV